MELDKERDFHRENRIKNEQKIKMLIQKLKFKVKIGLMKSQAKELKEVRKTIKAQEVIEKKWVETLFHYKQ